MCYTTLVLQDYVIYMAAQKMGWGEMVKYDFSFGKGSNIR